MTWENLLITQEGSLAHDYSESFLLRSAVCLGRRIKCSVKGLLILVFFFLKITLDFRLVPKVIEGICMLLFRVSEKRTKVLQERYLNAGL